MLAGIFYQSNSAATKQVVRTKAQKSVYDGPRSLFSTASLLVSVCSLSAKGQHGVIYGSIVGWEQGVFKASETKGTPGIPWQDMEDTQEVYPGSIAKTKGTDQRCEVRPLLG